MAIHPCHLSLITIHISDCRQFTDIHILQGSVSTYLSCGGIFKYFTAESVSEKKFENWLIFGEVMGKSFVSCFFCDLWCIVEAENCQSWHYVNAAQKVPSAINCYHRHFTFTICHAKPSGANFFNSRSLLAFKVVYTSTHKLVRK